MWPWIAWNLCIARGETIVRFGFALASLTFEKYKMCYYGCFRGRLLYIFKTSMLRSYVASPFLIYTQIFLKNLNHHHPTRKFVTRQMFAFLLVTGVKLINCSLMLVQMIIPVVVMTLF